MARKKYTDEFRQQAIGLAREASRSGGSMDRIAKDLGVHPNTLRAWVTHDDWAEAGTGKNTEGLTMEQELAQLKKENRLLKIEREILKKAAALFAKDSS